MKTEGGRPNSSGIVTVSNLPGMVPAYEENAARRKAGYTIPQWRSLDWIDRAIEVAMYRIDIKVDSIMQEEEMEKSRQSRPRGK